MMHRLKFLISDLNGNTWIIDQMHIKISIINWKTGNPLL